MATQKENQTPQHQLIIEALKNSPKSIVLLALESNISRARIGWLIWELSRQQIVQTTFKSYCKIGGKKVNYYSLIPKSLDNE